MSFPRVQRNKFSNQKTRGMDGCYYPSKCEAAVANTLYFLELSGEIIGYQQQFNVHISDETKWKVDFKVQMEQGDCYVEAKGFEEHNYRRKRKMYIEKDFEQKLPLFVYGHDRRRGVYFKEAIAAEGFEQPF